MFPACDQLVINGLHFIDIFYKTELISLVV